MLRGLTLAAKLLQNGGNFPHSFRSVCRNVQSRATMHLKDLFDAQHEMYVATDKWNVEDARARALDGLLSSFVRALFTS
jgi:hypothetical protein